MRVCCEEEEEEEVPAEVVWRGDGEGWWGVVEKCQASTVPPPFCVQALNEGWEAQTKAATKPFRPATAAEYSPQPV